MMAHAAEMPVPGGAFLSVTGLRVMGRADRTVHVRCDPFGRHRGVSLINPPIDPLTGYVRRRTAIVGGRRHPGLEPTHPAGRRSLGINATPSDHLPHHRIERRTVRVIHIIISSQAPEDRLPQKPDHGMWTVRVSPIGPPAISFNSGVSFNSRNSNGPPSEPIFEPWNSSRTRQPHPPAAPASRTRLSKPSLISPVSPAPCG